MTDTDRSPLAPLAHLGESEIDVHLRGYPAATVDACRRLRSPCGPDEIDSFLRLLLLNFLPAGTTVPPAASASGRSGAELRLSEDLGLDSLALAEAMFKIEELFDVRVENAELAEVHTIADAHRLLIGKLEETPHTP